jgi:hypothetical protein
MEREERMEPSELVWVKVRVSRELHRRLRTRAAQDGDTLGGLVVRLLDRVALAVGTSVEEPGVPVVPSVPRVPALRVEPARVPVGELDRVSREVVESEWRPAPGLSKADQARKGRGRKS